MNDNSSLYGVSMRGWICLVLVITACLAVLLKVSVDTQFYAIINCVVVAYVVQKATPKNGDKNEEDKSKSNGSSVTK